MNMSCNQNHGGKVVQDDRDADIVLVDEKEDVDLIRRRYRSNPDPNKLGICVETHGFIKQCLMDVKFTTEDDENLVYYLATVSSGSEEHMGNWYYRELMVLVRSCPSSLSIHSYINSSFFASSPGLCITAFLWGIGCRVGIEVPRIQMGTTSYLAFVARAIQKKS